MTKIIAVVSGKGGVGKTTVVSNMAAALTKMGKNVLIIDGNVSGPNLAMHLGIPEMPPISLNDVIKNRAYIMQAIYQHPLGFKVIPASLGELETELGGLKEHIKRVIGVYDVILIDSAPGVSDEVKAAMKVADEIVIVTNPEVPAVKNALMVKNLAFKMNKPVKGVIVNIIRGEKYELKPEEIEDMLGLPVIGEVKEHSKVREAIHSGTPVVEYQPYVQPSRAMKKIAAEVIGEKPPREGMMDKIMGFLYSEVVIKVR